MRKTAMEDPEVQLLLEEVKEVVIDGNAAPATSQKAPKEEQSIPNPEN